MSTAKTEALLLAEQLPLNETIYSDCPSCGGRKKLSVTRVREGVLWNCFKDSCSVRGRSIVQGELLPPKRKQTQLRPYRKPLLPLGHQDLRYWGERFCIGPTTLFRNVQLTEDNRYAIHIKDTRQFTRGYMVRHGVWAGEPECPRVSEWDGPKAVVYMHAAGPTLSWYPVPGENRIVLVEDQVSAMRAQEEGVSACALLGTDLDNDKVREIAMLRPSEVIIALDADATESAFKMARKWGLAFKRTRVAVLERDLKDEADGDIHHVLGLCH